MALNYYNSFEYWTIFDQFQYIDQFEYNILWWDLKAMCVLN